VQAGGRRPGEDHRRLRAHRGRQALASARSRDRAQQSRQRLSDEQGLRPRHRRLRRGAAARPQSRTHYLNRALAFKGEGEYARALADANKALELAPADPVALRGRGDIYVARGKRAEGDLDAAVADYSEAIRLDPRDAIAYRHRGLAYEAKGDGEHASADYNMVIQLRAK